MEARGGMLPRARHRARLADAGHRPWSDCLVLLALGHAAGPAAAAGAQSALPPAHAARGLEWAGAGAELERRRNGPRLSHRCRLGPALHAHDLPGVDAEEWQLFLKVSLSGVLVNTKYSGALTFENLCKPPA